jgi:hypothetical protein
VRTAPRRFKLFVTPGSLRFGRFGGSSILPPIQAWPSMRTIFSERWGEYASGDPATVAAANWTFSGATNDLITNGTNQIVIPRPQTIANSWNANTAALSINAGKAWELDINLACTLTGQGNDQHNFIFLFEDDGTGTIGQGVTFQFDGSGGSPLASLYAAGAMISPGFIVVPSFSTATYTLTCSASKVLTLKQGSSTLITHAGHATTGSKKIYVLRGVEQTFNSAGAASIGTLTLKGST